MINVAAPSRAERRLRQALHTRKGPERDRLGLLRLWHTTQPRPWTLKRRRRRANVIARASRKRNRR